ncbi:hypothetical protein C8P68_106154 [Mucilaginibacter yixingensis]|uniref:Uncharacterized protein n=1 Tax=Mucilaginibacter yixingensis TaxID=1295612 RepID=A0A2T5J715_9SPHI|nr:hypothetical protein C8P68_106154 [Mucilaginibacter yixingensis]
MYFAILIISESAPTKSNRVEYFLADCQPGLFENLVIKPRKITAMGARKENIVSRFMV